MSSSSCKEQDTLRGIDRTQTLSHQLDVELAFFNDEINEDVYVEEPWAYEFQFKEDMVYKLYATLYGFSYIDGYFLRGDF